LLDPIAVHKIEGIATAIAYVSAVFWVRSKISIKHLLLSASVLVLQWLAVFFMMLAANTLKPMSPKSTVLVELLYGGAVVSLLIFMVKTAEGVVER